MWMLRSSRRIRREAADWVARLAGGADERDHAAFREWYDADPRHGEAYDRMAAIWSAAGKLDPPMSSQAAVSTRGGHRSAYAIAASLAALIAVTLLLVRGPLFDASPESVEIHATSRGELRQLELPDGSRVMLDADSRIELAFSSAERRLILREGRARFSVAREGRPFIVQAGAHLVVATGTVFDVSLLNERVSVVMLEGSVELRAAGTSPPHPPRRLTAGQRLVIQADGQAQALPVARGDTAWTSRMLEFDDTPLSEAVETANRYSRVQIRIADGEVRSLRVSGAYRAGDSIGLARSLAAAFDLQLAADGEGNLTLSRRTPLR